MAYKRRAPPLVAQIVMGVFMDGFMRPMIRINERRGRAVALMGRFAAQQHARLRKKNPFRGYVPGPQDVFVMTYAKSGTNWMMQIAHQLIYHGQGEYEHLHDLVPWPDTKAMPFVKKYAIPIDEATHWRESPERLRVIKTHFDWDMLPYSDQAKYIAVIRDPKDIFVSNYHFIRDGVYGPAMPTIDTWFELFLSPQFPLGGSWAVNTAGYWAQRNRPNVLIASFKEMKRDLRAMVLKVSAFLNITVSDAVIDEVCRRSSFEYMKAIDHKFAMGKMIAWREPGVMIRAGKQGGSSEMLTLERQRQIDQHFIAELKRLGSDFPYDEFCTRA
jgi:sulfotransferase family protein